MKLKLRHSIYIMVFLCSFVPVCIWIIFSMYDARQRTENIITDNIAAIGGSQAMSIQNFCEGRKEGMENIAKMALVKNAIFEYKENGHSEALDQFLIDNEESKTHIASISVVDVEFHIVGSSQKYEVLGISDFQYSDPKNHKGEFIMGNVYERQTDHGIKRIIPAFVGIYDDDEIIGYLIEEIDCDYFNRLRLQTDFLEDGTLYLLDGEKQIITAGTATEKESRDELVTTEEERRSYREAWDAFDHDTYSEGMIHFEHNGQDFMTYFSDIEYTNWSIRITENMSAQWKANRSVYLFIVLEGLAIVGVLFLVQMVMTKKLVAPFQHIVQMMHNVQKNHDYTLRTGIVSDDEVGVVAQGIDELLEYIEKEELEEKRKHREYAEKAEAKAEAMQHKEFLSEAMLKNMPSGYHRCLPDAKKGFPFMQLGSHIEEILGWTAEEIERDMGNCYINLIWPEDVEVAQKYIDMVSGVGKGNAYDTSVYRMKHKDGGYRWITDATMFVDLGEESFFQGVIADITPYVEGMEEAKRIAEESSHAKTDFLSQMSHDIRTPMNAVIGFTGLAKQSDSLEEIQQEYIPKIETASNQLLMIINDVLEMNSIEKGKIVFQKTPRDMMSLMQDIKTVMQMQTQQKGIELITDVQITDRYVYCDENRFNRVFMNLLSNAVKFTAKGGTIKFVIEQIEEAKEEFAVYRFTVADTGIGMAPEFAPRVFEPFERERTSTVSRVEGTGLGMAIVKSIIDATGGTISVDSTLNVGTTFTIEIKLALVEPDFIDEVKHSDREMDESDVTRENQREYFEGKKILLAEDNEFNRAIAETILENAGFVVESADDGHIAVEMMQQAPAPDYYDVVLMDIQMPTMDGYEATKRIRAMGDARAQVKILAVTANAFESDKQKARDVGMDGHISKPIDVEVLYSTLFEIMEKK